MGRTKANKDKESSKITNTFSDDMQNEGFSPDTVLILVNNGFTDMDSLSLLGLDRQATKELKLPLADRLRLEKYLQDKSKKDTSEQAPKSLPKESTLVDLLAEMSTAPHEAHQLTPAPRVPPGAHATAAPDQAALLDPQVYLRDRHALGESVRPYDIVDYVNLVPPVTEEHVVNDSNGTQLVMRSAPRKPRLEYISVEDWCLANMRILSVMISNGGLNQNGIMDYMSYTIKICELFRTYQRVSVLQYDREYRHMQSMYGFRWGTDAPHLFNVHLVRRSDSRQLAGEKGRPASSRTDGKVDVCRLFNSQRGCSYGETCRYKHVCSVAGCQQVHPRTAHSASPANGTPTLGPPGVVPRH